MNMMRSINGDDGWNSVISKLKCRTRLALLVAASTIGMGVSAQGAAGDNAQASLPRFVKWLQEYIPEHYPEAKMIDHGGWVQGRMPGLVASWAEWNEEGITLKEVHDVEEGESLFISKEKKEDWPESSAVVYYPGVGYYIAGYASGTMSEWDVEHSSVVQFDGKAREFADRMAKARMEAQPKQVASAPKPLFVHWLKDHISQRYSDAKIVDHGGWVQAHVAGDLVASWAQWNEAGITLKGVEAHALSDGKSIFVSKAKRENWGESASVVYFPGVGYYIDGYASSTMSDWGVEHSTIIQFDGDAKGFTKAMAQAWREAN